MEYEIKSTAEYIECLKDLSKNGVDGYHDQNTVLMVVGTKRQTYITVANQRIMAKRLGNLELLVENGLKETTNQNYSANVKEGLVMNL